MTVEYVIRTVATPDAPQKVGEIRKIVKGKYGPTVFFVDERVSWNGMWGCSSKNWEPYYPEVNEEELYY